MKKMKKMYYIGGVEKEHMIGIGGLVSNLKLSWADGMIGILPVFDNKVKAKKYAGKNFPVTEIIVELRTNKKEDKQCQQKKKIKN